MSFMTRGPFDAPAFFGQVPLRGLGQEQKAIFPGEQDSFSDKDFREIEEILPGASETLQAICHNIQWYLKSLRAGDSQGIARDLKLVNEKLDTFGDKEPDLWIYLISYCKVPPGVIDNIHAERRKKNPSLFRRPIATPGRPAIPSPGKPGTIKTTPFPTAPGTVSQERPRVPSVDPITYGRRPSSVPIVTQQPQLPTYTDVATPSGGLTYSPDLQKQIQSYQDKLKEVYGTPTPTPTASRPPTPAGPTSFSDSSPGGCPPGQFPAYPGGPCRGGVATGGLPGIPGGAAAMPGALSPAGGGMPATSFGGLGARFPVMNIVRNT